MPERRTRRRGRKRLMHMADVQRQDRQQILDRARHIDGQRRHAPASARQIRQRIADSQHPRRRPRLRQQPLRILERGAQRLPRLPHRIMRPRRRDDHDTVPTPRQLRGDPLDVRRDVLGLTAPGIRRHMGDREALGRHPWRIGERRQPARGRDRPRARGRLSCDQRRCADDATRARSAELRKSHRWVFSRSSHTVHAEPAAGTVGAATVPVRGREPRDTAIVGSVSLPRPPPMSAFSPGGRRRYLGFLTSFARWPGHDGRDEQWRR